MLKSWLINQKVISLCVMRFTKSKYHLILVLLTMVVVLFSCAKGDEPIPVANGSSITEDSSASMRKVILDDEDGDDPVNSTGNNSTGNNPSPDPIDDIVGGDDNEDDDDVGSANGGLTPGGSGDTGGSVPSGGI